MTITPEGIEQICVHCGGTFRARRRRKHCSDECERRSKAAILSRLRVNVSGSVAAGKRAEAAYDKRCESETQKDVKQWYIDRHNERLAQGCTPVVPLDMVLRGVETGDISAVPDRVTRCLAVVEDMPGIFVGEEGEETDCG